MNRELVAEIAQIVEPWAWETKSWNATLARDDATAKAEQIVEFLAASPASLSGGAEEALIDNAARALYLAYAQHPEARWDAVDPAMQEGVWRAHIRAIQAGTIRVAPSPEAPANRQEAGALRTAIPGDGSGYQAGLFIAATIADDGFANAGDESEQRMARQIAAAIREEWQHDFDTRPALTSPKDVKGGEA